MRGKIETEREKIRDRERDRAGGNFWIELRTDGAVSERRSRTNFAAKSETKMLLADDQRRRQIASPEPDDRADEQAAAEAEKDSAVHIRGGGCR